MQSTSSEPLTPNGELERRKRLLADQEKRVAEIGRHGGSFVRHAIL
ncbi:hypothetical protein [Candidatus Accumulibacter aalborgensis]|nr:hypothetical protein [Candidatus Accumulibacter aalborgensis]